ncbi:homing endonuclease associated repeat-containing protein [Halobaculum magnesiiphilum]
MPREELLAELRAVANELGHPPTTTEMNEHGNFTIDPYQREFGTWRTALQAADPDYLENYRQSDTETVPFGSNWPQIREEIITRDNESCLRCGMDRDTHRDQFGRDLPVHHRIPRRQFYNDPTQSVEDSNVPSNLLTLCIPCHRRLERMPVQPVVEY